jgi:hypothetical protein
MKGLTHCPVNPGFLSVGWGVNPSARILGVVLAAHIYHHIRCTQMVQRLIRKHVATYAAVCIAVNFLHNNSYYTGGLKIPALPSF